MWITIHAPEGDRTIEASGRIVLGRDESCEVVLDDERVSRRHAAFSRDSQGRLVLEDLGSTNGTFVDERRLEAPRVLTGGERIRIGAVAIEVAATEPGTAAAPPREDTRAPATALSGQPPPLAMPPPPSPQPTPEPAASPLAATPQAQTPSRIERLALRRSVRRAQLVAIGAAVGVVVAVVIVVLVVTGVFEGEEAAVTTPTVEVEPEPPTIPELIAAIKPSTVQIRGDIDGQSIGLGTGWVLDAARGLVVTNSHVTNEAVTFSVRLGDETRERPAEVVGIAACEDLAVLEVADSVGFETLPLGRQSQVLQGESVVALGYPISLSVDDELIATNGVVSVVETRATLPDGSVYVNALQTDAVINPGNSGGPLVNLRGELVGVNTFKNVIDPGVEGQFYAIGVDHVREVVAGLSAGASTGWTGMGFYFPSGPEELELLGFPPDAQGLVVARVNPGTAADEAGFDDVISAGALALITAIDGTPVDATLGSWCNAVGQLGAGDSATFTVLVSGESALQDVTVGFE